MLNSMILIISCCIFAAWIIGVAWFSYHALSIIFSSFWSMFVAVYDLIYEFWYRKELRELREQERKRDDALASINYKPSRGHISLDAERDAGCRLAA